ncbi:MAG TPA: phosphoesterase [Blastocatellia bacterium]|nr:phosphoesterase [Blastocatellia bacterium]
MKVKVLFHNNCFDGIASAAVFSRFYRECINAQAEFGYGGLMHKAGQLFEDTLFDGDENAIVDFKYSSSEKLTWWFDHHESAFLTPEDEAHFRRDRSGRKFLNPDYKSCTKFIADTTAARFGFDSTPLEELIRWADIIDGAQYASPQAAVSVEEPAMKLLLVIEAGRDGRLPEKLIRALQYTSLADVAAQPEIVALFEPLYERHLKALEVIGRIARCEGNVVFFDISDYDLEGYNKFIPYYLFPQATYSIGVSRSPVRAKISVGSNPWAPNPRRHNLAKICERYGGGGHAAVAAISYAPDQLELARRVAARIVTELQTTEGETTPTDQNPQMKGHD